jgi:hypothetical protein
MRQAMAQLNFGNIGDVLPRIIGLAGNNLAIGANEQAARFEDQRYLAMSEYSFGARDSMAQATLSNRPLTAQAIGAASQAQLELANADPRLRSKLRGTLADELRAREHELMGFRSGDVAIDSGLSAAVGYASGLDLRGVGADRQGAAAAINRGIADIGSGKVVGGNGDGVDVLKNIYLLLQKWAQQIGKGSLPAMFQPN